MIECNDGKTKYMLSCNIHALCTNQRAIIKRVYREELFSSTVESPPCSSVLPPCIPVLPACAIVIRHTLFTTYAYKNIKKNIHAHPATICFHLSTIRWKVSNLESLADLLETIFVDLGAINHES